MDNDQDKIPAELKLKLLQAEKEINESIPSRFDWQRGGFICALTAGAFFIVGIIARAPIFSALGFAVCGGITGLLVGATHKPRRYDK